MAKKIFNKDSYNWNYCSVGGIVRVNLCCGEDIAHLDELDQKKWTVLSCPVKGLQMDQQTLGMIDADGDGKIRVNEVVTAAKWLTGIIKDKDSILKGESELQLDNINTENPDGEKIYKAAKLVLSCLGQDKGSITMDDAASSIAVFNANKFNGDGVITEKCTDNEDLKKVIASIIASVGPAADVSGEAGVNADTLAKFISECEAYLAWKKEGADNARSILPYAEHTADAYAACKAIDSKAADFFMRCKLVKFDSDAAGAVDVSTARIEAIGENNLSECEDQIATYPLARPNAEGILDINAINPAWQAAVSKAVALVGHEGNLTEAKWAEIMASFAPYVSYMNAKAGAMVEALGEEYVASVLKNNPTEELSALIQQDLAMASDASEIASINKLMHLYRDFYQFLNNYVIFSDFYARGRRAIFEAGELYIDERCCKLCIEVSDMGKHADMAGLSGMFLIYCTCTNKSGAKKDIVALMTDGDITNLRPGKNAIFYDLDGNDWDAVVNKVVDNPINLKKAFWAPYRKAANFVSEKINKNMAAKESDAEATMLAAADGKGKQAFDIAKFAGIFAAIGMAIGFVLSALSGFASFVGGLSFFQLILLVIAIMLVISGPSCFLAWQKLRKRNLGPVLNANGWAINSNVLVNVMFGQTLTSVAKYPIVRKGNDPFKVETPLWKKLLGYTIALLVIAAVILYFTNSLECIGLGYHPGAIQEAITGMGDALQESVQESVQESAQQINAEVE